MKNSSYQSVLIATAQDNGKVSINIHYKQIYTIFLSGITRDKKETREEVIKAKYH